MKIRIHHELTFSVGSGSAHAVQHILLTALSGPTQTVKDWSVEMPGMETAVRFTDAFGNRALLVGQTRPEGEITVAISGTVETQDRSGVLGRVAGEPVVALYRRITPLTEADPALVEAFADADRSGSARIALLHAIMELLGTRYRFGDLAPEAAAETPEGQTQSQISGAADDEPDDRQVADAATFAHGFIATARAFGIPARYVIGYLAADDEQPPAFHAWAEAYDEALGWIGFDAALGYCPTDRHVRVAAGLDALSTQAVRVVPQLGEPALLEISVEAVAQ